MTPNWLTRVKRRTKIEMAVIMEEGCLGPWLPGRIDCRHPGELLVVLAVDQGILNSLEPGTKVRLRYTGETALFWFDTVVTRQAFDGIRLVGLAEPHKVFRAQRRGHVRLEISLPVIYRVLGTQQIHKGRTLDLSAGGMAFFGDLHLSKGTALEVKVDLRESGAFAAGGEVVWAKPMDLGRRRFQFGLRFTDIDERTQDRITRFIFNQQSKLRRLGLL